jgi:hypothetical protein
VGNNSLISLTGLDNVPSIGGSISIRYNDALTSLTGLDNLTSIEGSISISYNDALTSLSGLDNIDAGSITDMYIELNGSLSTCEVQSICEYLLAQDGKATIHNNASGCYNQDEVELACTVSVDEVQLSEKLFIFPNPSSSQITIELPSVAQVNAVLTIYNMNAQQMVASKITEQKTVVDISGLPEGVYFVKIIDDQNMTVGKLVKN